MIKLFLPYQRRKHLTLFFDENGHIKLLSGGILHHFVEYRLLEEGISEIMMLLGEKILKLSQEKEAKIDSTPLEASRYDKHADYNPHYECKMGKAYITIVGTHLCFHDSYKRTCWGLYRAYQPY